MPFDKHQQIIKNLFCYVIRHYGNDGLSVLIYRQPANDRVVVICGDWCGNNLDLSVESPLASIANQFIHDHITTFITLMHTIKLTQAQLFFGIMDNELVLTDIQTSINKLAGPGMVRDIFGKIFRIQEVLKVEILDDRAMEHIKDGSGSYSGDLIIKPSRFRMYEESVNSFRPMYVEVIR